MVLLFSCIFFAEGVVKFNMQAIADVQEKLGVAWI